MKRTVLGIALPIVLALTGCSTFGPTGQQSLETDERPVGTEASYSPFNWSPPNYAGMTAGRIIYPGKDGREPVIAEWLSGKEAEAARIAFTTPDGTVITYDASGLRGFEGQLARSQVESDLAGRLAELWENVTPEIRTGLVDAVCLYVTKAPCGS